MAGVIQADTEQATGAEQGKRGSAVPSPWLLVVCCVAQFMVILDLSIVNVALPHIQSALNFSSQNLQWVVDAYAITFAGFLMLGGRAADQLGQRRVFVAALTLFGLTSLAGGLAQTSLMLVVARAIQGFSCAFMAASSLAIITSSFEPGPKLHRAIALWAAMNGLGGAAGVLLGGVITQELTWRWILLINPPIALATAAIAWRVVRDRTRPTSGFDLAGAVTLTVGQIVLVYGVVQSGIVSWHAASALGPILGGLALLVLFTVIEDRFAAAPLIPFKELTKPLKTANTVVILFSAALFPMWYVASLYLQQVLGLSPLYAGLTFLPMTLTIVVAASRAGKLVSRFGVRAVLGGGLVMMTAAMLLLARIAVSGNSFTHAVYYIMLPGILMAAGIGMSIVPSTIAATQGAKEGQAGLASGLVNTSRQIGGGLGLAVLITLATTRSSHLIGQGHTVNQSLTDGFRLAFLIGAGLAGAAAAMTFAFVGRAEGTKGSLWRRFPIAVGVAVAVGAFVGADLGIGGSPAPPIGAYTTNGAYSFVSAPALHPPLIRARVAPSNPATLGPGYIMLGNFFDLSYPPMVGQSGPLIIDNRLQPVWFQPLPTNVLASNLSRQTYHGKPVLAWWQGTIDFTGATETGEDVVVDQHYRPVATLRAHGGWVITLHDLAIDGDHAWVTANRNVPRNLSKYGGAYNGAAIDSAVQEYDLRTGGLLFSWDALQHIPLSDVQVAIPPNSFPWDAYHVNSIEPLPDGTFIVSMRNTWAIYKVDARTGRIVWTLGGRHSDFRFGPGAQFEWQHDAHLQPGSQLVTMFDDHCCQVTGGEDTHVPPTGPSRGLVLKLDQHAHTASFVQQYGRAPDFDPLYMGSLQPVPGGDQLVGWGSRPYFSEYSASGKLLLQADLPWPDLSYRARRAPWVGLPLDPPSARARRQGSQVTVYFSWNGATQVQAWRVLGLSDGGVPVVLDRRVPKQGFETWVRSNTTYRRFEVQALDARGRVVGTSRPVSAG
ncbi:MAG TPA: MFS transporter [Solirubrobacteraceae bacterium]|nr:MFS transporter [Solirubrobacteraceae bacterium]